MDLEDPVLILKEHLIENFSQVPVEGPTGYSRGGYSASFGPPPIIQEVEGTEVQSRKGKYDLQGDPAHAIIFLYEASWVPTEGKDLRQDFRDIESRVSIDIRTIIGRRALNALFQEMKRIVYLIHRIKNEDPSGNWSYVEPINRLNLTNRKIGIWRITYDVRFVKVSEFSGNA